jgi:hypothetical protein
VVEKSGGNSYWKPRFFMSCITDDTMFLVLHYTMEYLHTSQGQTMPIGLVM